MDNLPPQGPTGPVVINKLEQPQKTFFYQRPDGSLIEAGEKEAWTLHRKFKQYGVSDGTKYYEAVREAHSIFKETGDFDKAKERLVRGRQEEADAAKGNHVLPGNPDKMGPAASLI